MNNLVKTSIGITICIFLLSACNNKQQTSTSSEEEIETNTYQKGNQILEISKSEVGEYGYSRSYKLIDSNNKLLKLRTFEFNVDPDLIIIETVSDYTANPPKQYTRSQKMNKHFMQLNAKPEMVNGSWEVKTI